MNTNLLQARELNARELNARGLNARKPTASDLNASDTNHETTVSATADCGLTVVLDLLAAAGLAADAIYDGDAEGCPHCMAQVLSEAA